MAMSHPLADLVNAVMAREGWSDRKVAEQARAQGHKLAKSRVWELRNEPLNRLEPDTLHALAAGLDVPPRRVIQAALESAGLSPDLAPLRTTEDAVAVDPLLSVQEKEAIMALLQTFRNSPVNKRRAR